MTEITILVPSMVGADKLLQIYDKIFTRVRIEAKTKKSKSLPLCGVSVREIYICIWVLSEIPLTGWQECKTLQKVEIYRFDSVVRINFHVKLKA